MTDVEFTQKLAELSSRSKVLNQKSDSINAVIERLQAHLKEFAPGLEVWLDDDALEEDRRLVRNEVDDTGHARAIFTELGYARIGNVWGVAVRYSHYEYDEDDELKFLWSQDPLPLQTASRRLRIEALKHFPKLVDAIIEKVDEAIRNIEEAERYVSGPGDVGITPATGSLTTSSGDNKNTFADLAAAVARGKNKK
jgi:hypothetical protein